MQFDLQTTHSIMFKLVVALLLGAMIGIERQMRQRNSGLATHALVSLGAASYTSLAGAAALGFDLRMAANVITGIGFLGAGLIMRDGTNVRGLSTAATVWSTGAVGVFAGYGFLLLAVETTLIIVAFNYLLPKLGRRLESLSSSHLASESVYIIELRCKASDEGKVRGILLKKLNEKNIWLRSLKSHLVPEGEIVEVDAQVFITGQGDELIEELAGELSVLSEITATSWTKLDE